MQVRATIHLRNNAMIAARERLGLSQCDLAVSAHTTISYVGRLERLDYRVARRRWEAVSEAQQAMWEQAGRIADALDVPLSAILHPELLGQTIASTQEAVAELSPSRLLAFRAAAHPLLLEGGAGARLEATEELEVLMKSLSFRQRQIVEMIHGLSGQGKHSYQEVGDSFGLTGERVRQIERRAMRDMARAAKQRERLLDASGRKGLQHD